MVEKKSEDPKGVVLVFIDEEGREIASVSDFNRTGYGGWSLRDAQNLRARRALAMKVCNAYSSSQLVRAIDAYDAERIIDRLVKDHACKIATVVVGHAEAK